MAISNLKQAGQEISRLQKENGALQDRNQALEVENAELRDQLAAVKPAKTFGAARKAADQSEQP